MPIKGAQNQSFCRYRIALLMVAVWRGKTSVDGLGMQVGWRHERDPTKQAHAVDPITVANDNVPDKREFRTNRQTVQRRRR